MTHATGRAMGLYLTGTLNPCEDCSLAKVKNGNVSKRLSAPKFWERGCALISAHLQLPLLEVISIGYQSWETLPFTPEVIF